MNHFETMAETDNPYKCKLTVMAPLGKGRTLGRILSALTHWVDPSQQVVSVEERAGGDIHKTSSKKSMSVNGCLITPAISVMLYMRETGQTCFKDIEKVLKKPPWKFHHKVELQQRNSPKTVVGKHEFYKLADDLPLFAVCPVLTENEHLRINMYVHNFSAMVEFYRIVTDTEIETHKPEFCVFQLYQQPGLDIQLSLKRSQYICPVPVESAYVSFNMKNIKVFKGIGQEVTNVRGNVYTTRDPDGNLVVICETEHQNPRSAVYGLANSCFRHGHTSPTPGTARLVDSTISFDDLKSLKSVKSHDSGRYSDMDGAFMDNVFTTELKRKTKPTQIPKREQTDVSESSEGYESSTNSSNTVEHTDKHCADRKVKAPVKGTGIVKSKKVTEHDSKRREMENRDDKHDTKGIKLSNVTPVYI